MTSARSKVVVNGSFFVVDEIKMVYGLGFISCKVWLLDMIRVLTRFFYRYRGVPAEVSATFGAYKRRDSLRFSRWKTVNNNIFDPVSMFTRTATVVVPFAGIRIELQISVQWVDQLAAPQLFPQTNRIL